MSGQWPGRPELRIGDAEREAAVAALGEHYAAGRLTKEEFDERSERAYAARTSSAMWPLFADLPTGAMPAGGSSRTTPAGGRPAGGRRSGPPWWLGAMMPVLVVLLVLAVLTHLPFFLFVFVGWLLFARVFRLWRFGRSQDPRSRYYYDRHGPR